MRLVALSLAFILGAVEAHADLITYNMTGTISRIISHSSNLNLTAGDRIGWTLQFDPSLLQKAPGGFFYGGAGSPTIFNLVDLTTKAQLPSPQNGSQDLSRMLALVQLGGAQGGRGAFGAETSWSDGSSTGAASLSLIASSGTLSVPDLAKLNKVPFSDRELLYHYIQENSPVPQPGNPGQMTSIQVQADPLMTPLSLVPEPGSLTLSLVGAIGLMVQRLRSGRLRILPAK